MKRKSSCAALLAALLLGVGLTHGQDTSRPGPKRARTREDYKPRTLREIASQGTGAKSRGNKKETMRVEADVLPSLVMAEYDGASRPMPPEKKEVLRQWAVRFAGFPEGFTAPYQTELLFEEGGAKYWLAVKDADAFTPPPHLKLNIRKEYELLLIRVGAAKVADKWEPVLLVESHAWVVRGH